MSDQIPSHGDCLIIGRGSPGCNIAYHLTKLGLSDVVVLEGVKLTSGSREIGARA